DAARKARREGTMPGQAQYYRGKKCAAGVFATREEGVRHIERSAASGSSLHAGIPPEQMADWVIEIGPVKSRGSALADPARRCVALGGISRAVGLFFLIIAPSGGSVGGTEITNLHRLTLGET